MPLTAFYMPEPHPCRNETDGDVPPQFPSIYTCLRCLCCRRVTPNKDLSDLPAMGSYAEPTLCDLSNLPTL